MNEISEERRYSPGVIGFCFSGTLAYVFKLRTTDARRACGWISVVSLRGFEGKMFGGSIWRLTFDRAVCVCTHNGSTRADDYAREICKVRNR